MSTRRRAVSRRGLLQGAAASAGYKIEPRHDLAGPAEIPPSEMIGGALIGCGGRGGGTFGGLGKNVKRLASCDVKFLDKADNKATYSDYRRLLDRKDIEVVAIATHPGWHALVSIAAMEAGKDVLCEKPMARTIAEARAVAEAERRYGRIFQIGTFGRFGASKDPKRIMTHKIMKSGLYKPCKAVHVCNGGLKVREWSGKVIAPPSQPPANLDWDMYCGPAPLRPFHPHRNGGSHRGYWDYENGGMGDMGQHHFDPVVWTYAKDDTAPVEIEACAPPAHPEACGLWGWVECKYADGLTFVILSNEWGPKYDRLQGRDFAELNDLSEEDQKKVQAMPDPEPLVSFPEAVKSRKRAGGHATAAYRTVSVLLLANIAIRTGRKIKFDPVKMQVIGDDEANRWVYQPMRAPWRI